MFGHEEEVLKGRKSATAREVENLYIETKRHFGDKYRLIYKNGRYMIQRRMISRYWKWQKTISTEPVVGFWSFLGIGDMEFGNQELYAKKVFVDFVFSCREADNFKIV